VTDNGSLFAATRIGAGQLYTIEWHNGTVIDATPDFVSNEILIAPIGTYTVLAKHPTLNFCTSIADTVSVTDGRVYPQVTAVQKAPLTYCDPGKPNGVAFATVNGSVIGYTFDWYEGSAATSSYAGSEASILRASTYVVKATDVISGCAGTTTITIENDPLAIPIPQITLISNRTDCELFDGELSADVNGETKDYIFNWYNGAAVKTQVDGSGEIYTALDAGVYTVTAIDRASGCSSMPVQREIISVMLYPDFDITTVNTNCDENIGSASIKVSGAVEVKEIRWEILGAIDVGPQASALPSGIFTATAVSFSNCPTSKSFEIKTDLTIYNGVSRNSDGLNDFFEIGCISEYPNNSVKIFNRAGTLVFEASGYNNEDTYFDGTSNRGINILGNDLPDGTYFYIVNKGDGSEPKSGYLELLH
jgi:gliding motility-associated-like protein